MLKVLIEKEIKAWKIKYEKKIKELKAELTKTENKPEIKNRNYKQEMYNLKSDMKILIQTTDHSLGIVSQGRLAMKAKKAAAYPVCQQNFF